VNADERRFIQAGRRGSVFLARGQESHDRAARKVRRARRPLDCDLQVESIRNHVAARGVAPQEELKL